MSTQEAIEYLKRRLPAGRNLARLVVGLCRAGPLPAVTALAARIGWSYEATKTGLTRLTQAGLFVWGGKPNGRRLAPGIFASDLLAALGPPEDEAARKSPRCGECGHYCDRLVAGVCRFCLGLHDRPWVAGRVELLAARAAAGLPLFSPAPPWTREDLR